MHVRYMYDVDIYMYNYGRSEWSPNGYNQVLYVLPQLVTPEIGIYVQQTRNSWRLHQSLRRTSPPWLSEHPISDCLLTHQYTH